MAIRVALIGLGPIGAAVARQLDGRSGFRIVGAVDIDPLKAGKDAGDVLQVGRRLRVRVTEHIGGTLKAARADVAVLCTSSALKTALPQFEEVLKQRVPIVTTTEQAAYPTPRTRRFAKRLDEAARRAKVAVLGTGVNPGFVMDTLPIALTAACERVDRIEVHRVQDARLRRLPFQQKIGAGLTRDQFEHGLERGSLRHVGFTESIRMIADAVGWTLERVTDEVIPKIATQPVESELLAVDPGYVCGLIQDGTGYVAGVPRIRLHLEAYLGAPESYDSVLIEGSPQIHSMIAGGVHGDIATAAMVVNSIPVVLAAPPGLRTMRDLRLPSFYSGRR
ncbi:MAG: dihydrodipicolinate reductase [Acidobacteria bacterium]|nr:dihydrodipicolinate reductase [Acidobacteriota bacterium]